MTQLARNIARYDRARRAAGAEPKSPNEEIVLEGMTREEAIIKYSTKVNFVARRIAHRLPSQATVEFDDLVSAGSIGLLDALDKFDPTKNTSFGTYVEFRIRGAILDLLRSLDPATRTVREKSNQLQKVTRELEGRYGRPPEAEEIAKALGLKMPEYHDLLREVKSILIISIDQPRPGREDDGQSSLAEAIESDAFEGPDDALHRKEAIRELRKAIQSSLPERLREVLVMYYEREMNLKEIGLVLDVSESRVCQLHTEACLRLRAKLAEALRPGEAIDMTRRRPKKRARK